MGRAACDGVSRLTEIIPERRVTRPNRQHFRDQRLDRWLAKGAVVIIVALQLVIVNDLYVGARWLGPLVELALLVPLSIGSILTHRSARHAETDDDWDHVGARRRWVRRLAIVLTAFACSATMKVRGERQSG